MNHYRQDNTKGYSDADLAELNKAWNKIINHPDCAYNDDNEDSVMQSMLDDWSETLLFEYDAGKRDGALLACFYTP